MREGSPEAEARDILMDSTEYSDEIAEKIAKKKSPAKEGVEFLRSIASKERTSGSAVIGGDLAVKLLMESIGFSKSDAEALVEGGLMYALIQKKMAKWKPYEAGAVEAPEQKPEKAVDKPVKKTGVDFSLEDLGL